MKNSGAILRTIGVLTLCGMALGARGAAFFDDFESYAVGSNLHGQGGWAGWAGNASAGALVSTNFAFSPTRSVNITGASDLVHTFSGATNGQWVFSVMQYIPSTSTGTTYVVLMNTYRSPYGATDLNWSVIIQNNMNSGQIISDLGGSATLPMIKAQWMEVRCEINLASNSVSEFYNGQLLSTHAWQGGSGGPGLNEIQALDLFANNAGPAYYDNVSLGLQSQAADTLHLDIARTNSNVVLTWTNLNAALESSLLLPGVWNTVTGAVSPQIISPTNQASFFRLRATNTPASFAYLYVAPTFSSSIGDPFGCGCVSPENPNTLGTVGGAQDNGMGSVLLQTGELTQDGVALEIPGRGFNWRLDMRYRSGMSYSGPVGQGGWDFNYNRRLAVQTNGNVLCVNGLGRVDAYTFNTNFTFTSPAGFFTQLKRNLDGTFTERDRHGNTNAYSATNTLGIAQLSSISDRNANQMTFQYNAASQLTNVVDTLGRSIAYGYDASGRLTTVTDFEARVLRFTYNSNGDLASVTSPAVTGTPNGNDFLSGKTTLYTYSSGFADPRFNHNLLTVTAPNEAAVSGPPRLIAQYDTNPLSTNADRLVSLTLGGTNGSGVGAGGTLSFGYTSLGVVGTSDYTTAQFQNIVTNRHGNVTQYRFNQLGNVVSEVQYTRGVRVGDPAAYTNKFAYNADGLMIAQTNPALSSVQYVYNSANPNRLAQGNLLQTVSLPGPRGGNQAQIVVTHSYETNFNFVATTTDGRNNTMTFRYDSHGNRTNVVARLSTIVDDYAYNASGQMTSHVLPDNGNGHRRTDLMTYYSSGPQAGYLQQSIVDSGNFNLTTSYAYDLAGNVTNSIDARGSNTIFIVNSLNQVVRSFSRAVATTNGPVRYQQTFYYDFNNNPIRTDVQNIDDGGNIVASLPNFATTNVYDILDAPLSMVQQVTTNHFVTTAYQYDANGNRTLTRSGVATSGLQPNNVVSTLYDELDLVYQEILAPNDPNHSTTQLDYDGDQNLVRKSQGIESNPRISTFAYDGYDRQTSSTNPMGNVTTTQYDANANAVSAELDGELVDVPGSAGNVRLSATVYTYDAEDRKTVADAAFFDPTTQTNIGTGHAITSVAYSANSQVLTNIDANTNITATLYDTVNRVSKITDAKSNTVSYLYDPNGNVITKTEVDLSDLGSPSQTFQTANTFDSVDRLIQTVDQVGDTNRYAYDSRNNRLATTDGRGNVTRDNYDGLNRHTGVTRYLTSNGLGSGTPVGTIITSQSFDDNSRLAGQTDNNTNTTAYFYDALNRMTGTVFADGTTSGTVYDVHNNRITDTDANGSVVNVTYDLNNRPISKAITRGSGVQGTTSETNQYDGMNRTVSAANDGSIVMRGYDSLSYVLRETQQVLPGGTLQTVATVYDGVGNMLACTYPGGRVINYTYDHLNRLQMVTNSAGLIAAYNYFGPGRVQRRDYGNGTSAAFSYDGIRRQTNSTNSKAPQGQPIVGSIGFTDSFIQNGGSPGNLATATSMTIPAPVVITSSSGSFVGATLPTFASPIGVNGNPPSLIGNTLWSVIMGATTYSFKVTSESETISGASIVDLQGNGYVSDGNVAHNTSGSWTLQFTNSGSSLVVTVTSATIASSTNIDSRAYAWDAANNQTNMTDLLAPALDARSFSYDSADRLSQSTTAVVGPTNSYTLDGVGNRLNVAGGTNAGSYVMNPASPPADFQMNQYSTTPFDSRTYDANGNLTNAGLQRFVYDCWNRLVSYTNSTSGVAVAFKYDCSGRRIEKSGAATTNRYYYTGWQEIEEQNRTNATVATYVWGTYIDELLTTDRGGQRYFFHADDLGSIRKVTDSSGNVVEQYRYADYGLPTFLNGAGASLTNSAIGNATLFTGRRYDPETGLYYYRTRFLDPIAGRFTTRDTIGIWGDPGNLGNGYTYVGNSPMDDTDPDEDTSKSVNTSRSNVKDNWAFQGPPSGGGPGTGNTYPGVGIGGILVAEVVGEPIGGIGVGLGKKPNPGAQIALGPTELPGTFGGLTDGPEMLPGNQSGANLSSCSKAVLDGTGKPCSPKSKSTVPGTSCPLPPSGKGGLKQPCGTGPTHPGNPFPQSNQPFASSTSGFPSSRALGQLQNMRPIGQK